MSAEIISKNSQSTAGLDLVRGEPWGSKTVKL